MEELGYEKVIEYIMNIHAYGGVFGLTYLGEIEHTSKLGFVTGSDWRSWSDDWDDDWLYYNRIGDQVKTKCENEKEFIAVFIGVIEQVIQYESIGIPVPPEAPFMEKGDAF